jgi:hypothetical protein
MTDPNATAPKEVKEVTADANKPADPPQAQTPPPADIPRPTQLPAVVAEPIKQENVAKMMPLPGVKAEETPRLIRPEIRPHAFVVMPFGKKKGGDGSLYDFNAIYKTLIGPALEDAGFEPFRADEETTSGDILTDMFQELLLADLCICDLSIDNAGPINVL